MFLNVFLVLITLKNCCSHKWAVFRLTIEHWCNHSIHGIVTNCDSSRATHVAVLGQYSDFVPFCAIFRPFVAKYEALVLLQRLAFFSGRPEYVCQGNIAEGRIRVYIYVYVICSFQITLFHISFDLE